MKAIISDHDSVDELRDTPNMHVIRIDHNKLILERTDPYGFWVIHYEKGQLPEKLKGSYTSYEEAKKAVTLYLLSIKKKIREVV